jgi:predicted glycosyltransferase
MKILIDIKHPAQLNLFKGLAGRLRAEGWDVTICYLDRGKLPQIIEREYGDFKKVRVGRSRGSKWSILWEGNIKRAHSFYQLIRRNHYNIVVAASSIPLAVAAYITRTPVIQFYDDPERKSVNYVNSIFSNKLFFPPIVTTTSKIDSFNCLKEWAYLSPAIFQPDVKVLDEYSLDRHEYVFIREVSNKSFNYYDQTDAIISTFCNEISSGTKILLSLEDKQYQGLYPKEWTILQEPISDIHSLIYFSKLVVSSGDSMAREGAMLGVPSIYCGFRKMKANELLIKEDALHHLPGPDSLQEINKVIAHPFDRDRQESFRNKLRHQWVDMTEFMRTKIRQFKK